MTIACSPAEAGPFRCPTFIESYLATLALQPRGRAWPSNDGGATAHRYLDWFSALAGAIPASWPWGFVDAGFWAAIARVRNFVETRLCDLRLEFWCQTQRETHDEWMAEYGLPDACDPFPDLCTKVAAIGGTQCDYYAAIAARAGWSIACTSVNAGCGGQAGDMAGCMSAGAIGGSSYIVIIVDLDKSPAYVAPSETPPLAGLLQAGGGLSCPPDMTPLQCILDRIVHAHIIIEYQTIGG
ncbi:hypothetical protein [Bradyrhizobium sp. SZCCHNS2015]|uniref:hypothetical protein n=1 Tax=Bradyrhizobium sp. SZCCHNS2015 TaxID=3057305 RepID=UPI0028EF2BF3|nr:hypothetical protein [Bradyrhizobium sp. SZCCHNS2015]